MPEGVLSQNQGLRRRNALLRQEGCGSGIDYRRPMAPVSNSGCYVCRVRASAPGANHGRNPPIKIVRPYRLRRVQRPASATLPRAAWWWRQVAAIHMIARKQNAMGGILIRSRSEFIARNPNHSATGRPERSSKDAGFVHAHRRLPNNQNPCALPQPDDWPGSCPCGSGCEICCAHTAGPYFLCYRRLASTHPLYLCSFQGSP